MLTSSTNVIDSIFRGRFWEDDWSYFVLISICITETISHQSKGQGFPLFSISLEQSIHNPPCPQSIKTASGGLMRQILHFSKFWHIFPLEFHPVEYSTDQLLTILKSFLMLATTLSFFVSSYGFQSNLSRSDLIDMLESFHWSLRNPHSSSEWLNWSSGFKFLFIQSCLCLIVCRSYEKLLSLIFLLLYLILEL